MKRNIIFAVCILTLGLLISNKIFKKSITTGETYNGLPVSYSHASYAYDMSTPEKAIGATDYVFVAKIEKQVKTEYRNPIEIEISADGSETKTVSDPYTIYEVSVIENIKGELPLDKNITIEQMGGISEDGKMYILLNDTELLKEGSYYIILACVTTDNGELQINSPSTYILLEDEQISTNSIVNKYIDAYKNQEVPVNKTESFKSKYDNNRF